jgi:hypothetical protein
MRALRSMLAVGALMLGVLVTAPTASANDDSHKSRLTCSGASLQTPGTIAPGTYDSLTVKGVCLIPGGDVNVKHSVVVTPGSTFLANFPPAGPGAPEGAANLTVGGNVLVQSGATLFLGCSPMAGCKATTHDVIKGDLIADHALGVVAHSDTIRGNVIHNDGGGGPADTCKTPTGIFADFGIPNYTDYEDSVIGGNVVIAGVRSCWMGVIRDKISGNVVLADNQLADPDAIEVLSNTVNRNLVCIKNSAVWDSADQGENLFPRTPQPNTVNGHRIGQCTLASPTAEGDAPGPGPF